MVCTNIPTLPQSVLEAAVITLLYFVVLQRQCHPTPTKVTVTSRTMAVMTKNRTAGKVDPDALLDSPCPVLGGSLKATLAYNQKIVPYLPPF